MRRIDWPLMILAVALCGVLVCGVWMVIAGQWPDDRWALVGMIVSFLLAIAGEGMLEDEDEQKQRRH